MNDRKCWDNLTAKYIREVEKALADIDHPRKAEVLADLRIHLEDRFALLRTEEKTADGIAAIFDEMESPAEYAQLLAPQAAPVRNGWRRRNIVLLITVLILLLASTITALFFASQSMRAHILDLFGRNYTGTPFFTKQNFKRIELGMNDEDVRHLIGFPFHRASWSSRPDQVDWRFTVGAFAGAPFWRSYVVMFDRKTKRVVSKETRRVHERDGAHASTVRHVKNMKQYFGTFWFRQPKKSIVIKHTKPTLYIFGSIGEGINDLEERIKYREKVIHSICDPLDPEKTAVIYLLSGYQRNEANLESIEELEKVGYVMGGGPASGGQFDLDRRNSRILFLKSGWLYEPPPVFAGPDDIEQMWRDDRRWLYRKLLNSN